MLHHPLTHMITPLPLSFPVVVTAQRLPRWQQPPPRSCRSLASSSPRGGKGMKRFHEIELEVRGYELDRFGIVNNSVYNNYCELGKNQLADNLGFDVESLFVFSEASYKYIAPLREKDKFLLKVRIYDYSAVRLYFEDFIFKLPNHEPILECKSTVVLLDKKLLPTRLPRSVVSNMSNLYGKDNETHDPQIIWN